MDEAQNKRIQALKSRMDNNLYVRHWVMPLMSTCVKRPGYCCYAMWCPYCASYQLRKQALHGDMSRYICCAGHLPCSGRCGESSNPQCCLCMEVVFCFGQSVASTRFMVQDELRLETTQCDQCIIGTMIALQYLACICHLAACILGSDELAAIAQIVDLLADIAWCTVCACMQTQHKIEMDERDKNPGSLPPPLPAMAPAVQMMAYPPPPPPQPGYGGYPPAPQPGYNAPPPGYGAPPPPGYGAPPPPGYGAPPPQYYPPPQGQYSGAPGYNAAPPPGYPGAPPQQPGMYK